MLTKQDEAKKILKNISDEKYNTIKQELAKIEPFAAHENNGLTAEQRAVMTKEASQKMKEIFDIMKLDYRNDPNLKDTPMRISSMWVNELMVGRYQNAPRIEAFPNQIKTSDYSDNQLVMIDGVEIVEKVNSRMVVSKKVDIDSLCSHHFMPFFDIGDNSYGLVAYKPSDKLLGISKLQRVINYFGARPQLQEQMLGQVHEFIKEVIQSDDVMVIGQNIMHTCETARGVKSAVGRTSVTLYSGIFEDSALRQETLLQAQ